MIPLTVPALGESVSEATIAKWAKGDGDYVTPNDVVVELETDKANVEIPASGSGVLKTSRKKGDTVAVGDVIAQIDTSAKAGAKPAAAEPAPAAKAPAAAAGAVIDLRTFPADDLSPAVRALVLENKLTNAQIPATGPGGRLTKEDVLAFLEKGGAAAPLTADSAAAANSARQQSPNGFISSPGTTNVPNRPGKAEAPASLGQPTRALAADEEREEMPKLRQTIARRLVEAQHTTASLTTFNEVDMSAVMGLRERYKEGFEKSHGIGLGFMSFFAKAVIYALKHVPQVNYSIDGNTLIKRKSVHLGIAVSTEKGLMVPVLKNAQSLSMAQIEAEIKRLALKARDGKITVDDMTGGTFTITNGGVFGSLLSTPILNPPQAGILGMHKIEKRAVVATEGGKDAIVVRPMMYLALTYDHRLVDGKQSVTFLVKVKEALEEPARMLLEV
ncbi:MAG TPA: 2-oxoglutarate dehydrogenase complex dihydrolipoyllysine-residue succinyltransferase [Phycisphaerae bacterium]|jgi:2-oxoglutarate dehydrogenase E2 component (dihydrolipoamide succinyltransferase)|nr:2-oxoglutarate dehydrogenase complex dihydrolipoyllysine-residue succinyltransferase [Phycisphaerae bacterium]